VRNRTMDNLLKAFQKFEPDRSCKDLNTVCFGTNQPDLMITGSSWH
jgi:hypothetical protein